MKDKIRRILIERGYPEKLAESVSADLSTIDEQLKEGLQRWMANKEESDFVIQHIRLSEIKRKFDMTYPAALLTMDWLIKEPEKAIKSINHGIR